MDFRFRRDIWSALKDKIIGIAIPPEKERARFWRFEPDEW